ncbi:hypothetical protein EYF80_047203 [Liparis tanakae]|uniref:Uncharacterized protein n=1 Tax=Liparis tanakae TaxID=230148 RepID=A0A4Z2FMZ8_9TELE|nr:hypothetical protein EYF80_047203 [Liparis tanakae]
MDLAPPLNTERSPSISVSSSNDTTVPSKFQSLSESSAPPLALAVLFIASSSSSSSSSSSPDSADVPLSPASASPPSPPRRDLFDLCAGSSPHLASEDLPSSASSGSWRFGLPLGLPVVFFFHLYFTLLGASSSTVSRSSSTSSSPESSQPRFSPSAASPALSLTFFFAPEEWRRRTRSWDFRWPACLKPRWHTEHLKGRSPVCTAMCLWRESSDTKSIPQM